MKDLQGHRGAEYRAAALGVPQAGGCLAPGPVHARQDQQPHVGAQVGRVHPFPAVAVFPTTLQIRHLQDDVLYRRRDEQPERRGRVADAAVGRRVRRGARGRDPDVRSRRGGI